MRIIHCADIHLDSALSAHLEEKEPEAEEMRYLTHSGKYSGMLQRMTCRR